MAFTLLGKQRKAAAEEKAKSMANDRSIKEIEIAECKKMQEIAPDMNILCDDETTKADIVLPAGADCETAQSAAEKIGVTVLCDDETK